MLERSLGLFFYLKRPKNQDVEISKYIYLRITVNGISKDVSTKRKCLSIHWNQKTGSLLGNKSEAKLLNAHLRTILSKCQSILTMLLGQNREISSQVVKDILLDHDPNKVTILEALRKYNKDVESLVGKGYAQGTLERYNTSYQHVQRFIVDSLNKNDIFLLNLNYDFVRNYFNWLKINRNCGQNSALKYISNLKTVVLECIRKGLLDKDPFIDFRVRKQLIVKDVLTAAEINIVLNHKFLTPRLEIIQDIFLFSCYTGLAYSDIKNLTNDNIEVHQNGETWIKTQRIKTGIFVAVPLLKIPLNILYKYKNYCMKNTENKILPIPSNQKTNEYLKEIANICGIRKILTFHIARHTFATTVTLNNGVSIESISKMLGHTNIKQTQRYAMRNDQKVAQEMKSLSETQ